MDGVRARNSSTTFWIMSLSFMWTIMHCNIKKADLSGRIARWVVLLQEFTLIVPTQK